MQNSSKQSLGYGALKQIRGINSAPECPPSSSRLQTAILSENTAAAAKLIESGVDLNDKVDIIVICLNIPSLGQS